MLSLFEKRGIYIIHYTESICTPYDRAHDSITTTVGRDAWRVRALPRLWESVDSPSRQ